MYRRLSSNGERSRGRSKRESDPRSRCLPEGGGGHRPDRPANRRTYGGRCVPKRVHTPAHACGPVCASLCTLASDSSHVCCGQTACGGLWNRREINRIRSPPKRSFQSNRGGESVTCRNRRQQGKCQNNHHGGFFWLGVYHELGVRASKTQPGLILTGTCCHGCGYRLHFTDEEAELQRE